MKFRNMMLKYYAPAEEDGAAGGGGSTVDNSSADNDADDAGKDADDAGKAGDGKDKAGDSKTDGEGKSKLSDKEAGLLKDMMKHKEAAKTERANREKLEEKLKDFEGIDPVAVRDLLEKQKKAQEEELEKKGQWDALKQNMIKAHSEDTVKLQSQIESLQAALNEREATIDELTIGASFGDSKFLKEETTLASPAKARALYGNHFELVDGVLTAFDKPKGVKDRAPLVDASGNSLDFDNAMRKIIESDPDKDALLRSKVRSGAGSDNKSLPGKKIGSGDEEKTSINKIQGGLGSLNIPKQ